MLYDILRCGLFFFHFKNLAVTLLMQRVTKIGLSLHGFYVVDFLVFLRGFAQ